MPSQISLRTSPVLSNKTPNTIHVGHKAVITRNSVQDGADMKAAARAVGSFLVTHKSIRKPHNMVTVSLNGSCGNSDTPKCFSMGLHNGNATVNMNLAANHHSLEQVNDTLSTHHPLTAIHCNSPKTEAQQSNDQSSLTDVSNKGRLMCPELAISYTGTLIGKRAGCLVNKQSDLEQRVTSLQRKIRLRQLHMVHSHTCRQLEFDGNINEQDGSSMEEEGSGSSLTDSDFSMEISPPRTVGGFEGGMGVMDLPIQVDGASDDAFLPTHDMMSLEGDGSDIGGAGRKRNEDSFSSLDSYVSSVCPSEVDSDGGADGLIAQLASLEALLDGDMTDASSDEEGEQSADILCKYVP